MPKNLIGGFMWAATFYFSLIGIFTAFVGSPKAIPFILLAFFFEKMTEKFKDH